MPTNTFVQRTCIDGEWKVNKGAVQINKVLSKQGLSSDPDYKVFRQWQQDAFLRYSAEPYLIINAPTAAGKTLFISGISAARLNADPTLKVIITVPLKI